MLKNDEMGMIRIPERYQKVKSLPEDPENSSAYAYQNEGAGCFLLSFPIPKESAMPYGQPEEAVKGIHEALGDNQGLIEVESGKTGFGSPYIYSIVKSLKQPSGVQYCMTMHVDRGDFSAQVQGFFEELGTTGFRDALIFALAQNENLVKMTENGIEGWNQDPYDSTFVRGNTMNLSEKKEYDNQFPTHPLSEARKCVSEIISMN